MTKYGPHNPHPLSTMRTELVWDGKYDEFGNRREATIAGLALPLQRIESIDEPRSRAEAQGTLFDEQKAHRDDFRNRLIWGDNKLVIAALLEEFRGKIDLIYIDPPFDVGADFTMSVPIGDARETVQKDQSVLEMVAYRDVWGKGTASYFHTMFERLSLMRELLSEEGSAWVHVGPQVSHQIKIIMDEVFGAENFLSEIVWKRTSAHGDTKSFGHVTEQIFGFSKAPKHSIFNVVRVPFSDDYVASEYRYVDKDGRRFRRGDLTGAGIRYGETGLPWRGLNPTEINRHWGNPPSELDRLDKEGLIYWPPKGKWPHLKIFLDERDGSPATNIWTDIPPVNNVAKEGTGYATQKPEALLERLVAACSNPDSIVADFFIGSGTTLAVAEKLGRKWIGCDLGRFAIHTARKRLISLQRDFNDAGKPYRSFDVYNLGRYERQWWQKEALRGADDEHRKVVLGFFRAEELTQTPSPLLHGRKGTAFVHVDGIDSVFSRGEVVAVAEAVKAAGGREVHCLAWDFEMEIRQVVAAVEAEHGVKVRLHRIPREIMERNRAEVPPFFEVALLEAAPVYRKNGKGGKVVDIKLESFLPSLTEVPSKELEALQERAVESGFDFIDFWAVDFDWKPGQPFNHHWQEYRTRKDRSLKTVSDAEFLYASGSRHTACVKVVDVFGCDTSITVEIEV